MAYVAKNGFRQDDFRPYLYKTTDFGATWTPLGRGLPDQPINVVWQDRRNPRLLFVGNDKGVWVSIDDGAKWVRMKGNMPEVPVHDLLVHPREQDLLVGTYGRGMYLADVSVLQQVDEKVLAEDAHVFDIEPRSPFQTSGWGNYDFYGDRYVTTPNEPNALMISYYLRDRQEQKVSVVVANQSGRALRTLEGPSSQGVNIVRWDMRDSGGRMQPRGDYVVTVDVSGRKLTKTATIRHPLQP
jgi:hypothetical protein